MRPSQGFWGKKGIHVRGTGEQIFHVWLKMSYFFPRSLECWMTFMLIYMRQIRARPHGKIQMIGIYCHCISCRGNSPWPNGVNRVICILMHLTRLKALITSSKLLNFFLFYSFVFIPYLVQDHCHGLSYLNINNSTFSAHCWKVSNGLGYFYEQK